MTDTTLLQRARCRWRGYHTWIDADGDGLTDTCAVCGTGVFAGRLTCAGLSPAAARWLHAFSRIVHMVTGRDSMWHLLNLRPLELPMLTDDERAWLQRLIAGPIRRDAKGGVPYGVATALLSRGFIMPGTEVSQGLARQTWRVWRITVGGHAALHAA